MAAALASIGDAEIASKPAANNTLLRSDLVFMGTASLGPKSPSTVSLLNTSDLGMFWGGGQRVYPRVL